MTHFDIWMLRFHTEPILFRLTYSVIFISFGLLVYWMVNKISEIINLKKILSYLYFIAILLISIYVIFPNTLDELLGIPEYVSSIISCIKCIGMFVSQKFTYIKSVDPSLEILF